MSLVERMSDALGRIIPAKSTKPSRSMSGGIGRGGHGMVPFGDNMILSKPAIVFHSSQIFFNFLAMACFASVASFQAKWGVGPSGLSGFALFISVAGMSLSAFMLLIPVFNEKYDKFTRLARALKEVRVAFILNGTGTGASLLISFIVTISAWTQPGCKDPNKDPHAKEKGDGFKKGLDEWCNTKKAAAIFFWLAFGFWLASFILLILDWRSGKLLYAPRDPPFAVPEISDIEEGDEEDTAYTSQAGHRPPLPTSAPQSRYDPPMNVNPFSDANTFSASRPSYAVNPSAPATSTNIPTTSIPASRPSVDAYGAFSDPAPSGFGGAPSPSGYTSPAPANSASVEPPKISRTMQYADPYSAVRASVAGSQYTPSVPPSYDSYQYR